MLLTLATPSSAGARPASPQGVLPPPSYLPGGTLNTLAAGGNNQLSWGAALGLVILYGLIATTVSLLTFRARDITS